jgi:hypothetical protein
VDSCGADTLLVRYDSPEAHLWVVSRLRGSGVVTIPDLPHHASVVLTTEDAPFASDGKVPRSHGHDLEFAVPATVVFASPR